MTTKAAAFLFSALLLPQLAFGRTFITFYDLDRTSPHQFLVMISPQTPPAQEIATLSALQWLWDELIKNKNISVYAFARAQAVLQKTKPKTPAEKLAVLQRAVIALVDEEIIYRFWSDPRLKDSEDFLDSKRWSGLRLREPLDDGKTAIAFVFGKAGIVSHFALTVAEPGSLLKAEEEYAALSPEQKTPATSSSVAVQLPNSASTGFQTVPIASSTKRTSGEFRRLYNSTSDQTAISVLAAAMLMQRQFFVHTNGLAPDLHSVVDRLWIRTDFLRSKLYSSPTRGYGFTEVGRVNDPEKGETAFLLGDTSSYMAMVKKNEKAVFDRTLELTMMRSLFSDGPYRDTPRGRQPIPATLRSVDYIYGLLQTDISKRLKDMIDCSTELRTNPYLEGSK